MHTADALRLRPAGQMRNCFAFGKRKRFPFCRAGPQHPRPPFSLVGVKKLQGERERSAVHPTANVATEAKVMRPHERRSRIRCGR